MLHLSLKNRILFSRATKPFKKDGWNGIKIPANFHVSRDCNNLLENNTNVFGHKSLRWDEKRKKTTI